MSNICHCYYDILLLNPNKNHSNKTIRKSSRRILRTIYKNVAEFKEEAVIIAQHAAKAIITGSSSSSHSCEIIEETVKLIKHKIASAKILTIQQGTRSEMALIPYHPENEAPATESTPQSDPRNIDDILRPIQSMMEDEIRSNYSLISMDLDTDTNNNEQMQFSHGQYDDNDSMVIEEGTEKFNGTNRNKRKQQESLRSNDEKANKKIRFEYKGTDYCEDEKGGIDTTNQACGKAKAQRKKELDAMLKAWIQENRRKTIIEHDDEIENIIGHWYKYEKPRFKCSWKNKTLDTVESSETLILKLKKNVKPLNEYLKNISERAFETLVNRAPELIITVLDSGKKALEDSGSQ